MNHEVTKAAKQHEEHSGWPKVGFLRALRAFVVNRRRQLVLALIVLPSAALALALLTTGHDWGDDFAGNIIQASGLLHGTPRESVAHVAFTMRGSSRSYAPIAYPWGFPALLAPVYLACGELNIFCLKLINVPSFALFLAAFFVLIVRRLSLVDARPSPSITSLVALAVSDGAHRSPAHCAFAPQPLHHAAAYINKR